MTNAYVLYTKTFEREEERRSRTKMKCSEKMTKKLTHFQFLEILGMQLLWSQDYLERNKKQVPLKVKRGKRTASGASTSSTTSLIYDTIKRVVTSNFFVYRTKMKICVHLTIGLCVIRPVGNGDNIDTKLPVECHF